jgi:hypothetical protein
MRERIAKPNLNHGLLFGKSNRAMWEIITKSNHGFFLKSNRVKELLSQI